MGKTHYLKHLLHQLHKGKRQFDAVFVFSEKAALQPDNFYCAPPAFMYDRFDAAPDFGEVAQAKEWAV
jgi:hypothetical protein